MVLTNDAHVDTDPAYSPDGSQIAFVRQTDGGEFTLWTMPADGGAAVALTPPGVSARHPSWSPDGAHIVFDRAGATSGRDLWVVDATGGGLHSIVTHAGSDSEPAWSPDGLHIAFTTDRYGGSDIVTVTPDGAGFAGSRATPRTTGRPHGRPTALRSPTSRAAPARMRSGR